MYTLNAESLNFAYEPGSDVLRGVNASVIGGRITGLVGPNGSGKSTLLRLLCGFLQPNSGTVKLDGRPLVSLSAAERARTLAFLPQMVDPVFSLTVFEVVCLGRYPYTGMIGSLRSHDLEVVARCLQDTETEPLRHREFGSLSGGERQRVLLASILAQEPKLMLLDEPTSSLDIHHEVEVFELLARLARQGYGIAVVTHDLNLAAQYCEELLLLSADHSVLASGKPEEVFTEALLSTAYAASIRVGKHPFTGAPFVAAQSTRETPP
ncbi:MAG TPA: ABC transporter ATP-binding protein [Candidatus Hydrogenedentes bacterium]|nr:ABC transporter ATP-binding protein [Candidatus Hydrogenedentota bacterium]